MRWGLGLAAMAWTASAWALPAERRAEANNRDGTLAITVFEDAIQGDSRSFCRMAFALTNGVAALSQGDPVTLEVVEDDVFINDVVWQQRIQISAEEAEQQLVRRVFDCSTALGEDGIGALEIFGRANVARADCGFFCNDADPKTANIIVQTVDDDGREEDDASAMAAPVRLGTTADSIARDQDWLAIQLGARSALQLEVIHVVEAGRLDLTLFDEAGAPVGAGEDGVDRTFLDLPALEAGNYTARVQPRDGADYNFYDLGFSLQEGRCAPGEVEESACGACGARRRQCDAAGDWGGYGECENEQVCAPGDERSIGCGQCGEEVQTCTVACEWQEGVCGDEGPCTPGDVETEVCGEGVRERWCELACEWGDFGDCVQVECADGDQQPCYEGPVGTEGVGTCAPGVQVCDGGRFTPCRDWVGPNQEECFDGLDNDCDGAADDDDPACEGGPEVGDSCDGDQDCGNKSCLETPTEPQFRGGYCSLRRCDAECPDDAICGQVFGERVCLKACASERDCRATYRCADVAAGRLGCVPACSSRSDCTDP
jgi:hypothetical protein